MFSVKNTNPIFPNNQGKSNQGQGFFNKSQVFQPSTNQSQSPFKSNTVFSGSQGQKWMPNAQPNNQNTIFSQQNGQNPFFGQGGQTQNQNPPVQRQIKTIIGPNQAQNQNQSSGFLWNNNQSQNNNKSGGIFSGFGNTNSSINQSSGIFSQSNNSTQGIFNSNSQTNNAQAQKIGSGSIFTSKQSNTSSIFGSQLLFGQSSTNQPQQQQSNGFFNTNPSYRLTLPAGLFNKQTPIVQQSQQQQGIFSSSSTNQNLQNTTSNSNQGIFPSSNNSGSVFTNTNTSQSQQTGLFNVLVNQNNSQVQQSTTQSTNSIGLWGNNANSNPIFPQSSQSVGSSSTSSSISQTNNINYSNKSVQPITNNSSQHVWPNSTNTQQTYSNVPSVETSQSVFVDAEKEVAKFSLFAESISDAYIGHNRRFTDSYSTEDSFNEMDLYDKINAREKFIASTSSKMKRSPNKKVSLLPRTEKYILTPTMEQLAGFSNEELSCVEGFIIENQHVKIAFRGPVDLRCADLDAVFHLEEKSVEINSEINTANPDAFKQPAELTFFNWEVPTKYSNKKEAFITKLQNWVEKFGGTFVDYDEDRRNLYAFVDCI